MAVTSADYVAVVASCRNALSHGTSLAGEDLRKVIDVIQDSVVNAAALEASLVTHMAAWVAVAAADSSAVRTTALAALSPLRTAVISTSIPTHTLDGRAS